MTIANDIRLHLNNAGFSPDDLLLLAVSGGPDSLVMAYVLHSLGWKIALAHFDHQLRNQSTADCQFVKNTAATFQIDFYQGSEDIQQKADLEKRSVEEVARDYRYRFLFSTAVKIKAKAVLTAHTADDQIETVLMHLLRGSGLHGLAGMQLITLSEFHSTIPLVRPLLTIWRKDIEAYCTEFGLNPVQDASNQEVTYFRNRIRHELIPNLESYNPAIKENILHLAEIVQDDWAFLEKKYTQLSKQLLSHRDPDSITIPLDDFLKLERGAQKAILLQALNSLQDQPQEQVEYRTIDAVMQFIHMPTTTRHISLPAYKHAFLEKDHLVLTRNPSLPVSGDFPQCGEIQAIPTGESFKIKVAPCFILTGTLESIEFYKLPESQDGFIWECYLAGEKINLASAIKKGSLI